MSVYIIIRKDIKDETDVTTFEHKVSSLLNEGWQLAGGISTINKYDYIIYNQALIKIKEPSYGIMDGFYS